MFRLKPDLLVDQGSRRWVLDTKWKRIDETLPKENYGLSQADFYQLFAYGHKYRVSEAQPVLALIYPKWKGLSDALPVFEFGEGLQLHVLPFDLDRDYLMGAQAMQLPLAQAIAQAS